MNEIEKIEAKLKQISKWPWRAMGCGVDIGQVPRGQTVYLNNIDDAHFIAASPDRIAKLVEYVRAVEAYHKAYFQEPYSEAEVVRKAHSAMQVARAELGLTKPPQPAKEIPDDTPNNK